MIVESLFTYRTFPVVAGAKASTQITGSNTANIHLIENPHHDRFVCAPLHVRCNTSNTSRLSIPRKGKSLVYTMIHPVVEDVLALSAATTGFTNKHLESVAERRKLLPLLRQALIGLRDFDCPPTEAIDAAERWFDEDCRGGKYDRGGGPKTPPWSGYEPAIPPLSPQWHQYVFKSVHPRLSVITTQTDQRNTRCDT